MLVNAYAFHQKIPGSGDQWSPVQMVWRQIALTDMVQVRLDWMGSHQNIADAGSFITPDP
jgi:hypothetical protein